MSNLPLCELDHNRKEFGSIFNLLKPTLEVYCYHIMLLFRFYVAHIHNTKSFFDFNL